MLVSLPDPELLTLLLRLLVMVPILCCCCGVGGGGGGAAACIVRLPQECLLVKQVSTSSEMFFHLPFVDLPESLISRQPSTLTL